MHRKVFHSKGRAHSNRTLGHYYIDQRTGEITQFVWRLIHQVCQGLKGYKAGQERHDQAGQQP